MQITWCWRLSHWSSGLLIHIFRVRAKRSIAKARKVFYPRYNWRREVMLHSAGTNIMVSHCGLAADNLLSIQIHWFTWCWVNPTSPRINAISAIFALIMSWCCIRNKIVNCYRRYKHGIPPATHGWSRTPKFQPANFFLKKNLEQLETLKRKELRIWKEMTAVW